MDVHPWELLAEINPRTVVDVLEAALTPVIAVVTVLIAYNQWRVNKIRLDVDLYDRRLAVYKAVDAFYEEVGKHGTANYPMVSELRQHTVEAAFLFPTGVEEH
jgi:hypothetical protein